MKNNRRKPNYNSYGYRVGQNIAKIRETETGMTQADMEIQTGISRAYYGRIELGLHSPSLKVLVKIANALNVDITRLFMNENNDLV